MSPKIKYYVLAAILAVIYGLFTLPSFQEWEAAYLLITMPIGMWIIYKVVPQP